MTHGSPWLVSNRLLPPSSRSVRLLANWICRQFAAQLSGGTQHSRFGRREGNVVLEHPFLPRDGEWRLCLQGEVNPQPNRTIAALRDTERDARLGESEFRQALALR